MRVIEAAVSLFFLVDRMPIFSNTGELDALITFLALISTPEAKLCLCKFSHQILMN
jgi:hypothetical protein